MLPGLYTYHATAHENKKTSHKGDSMNNEPTLFDAPPVNIPLANKIDSFYSKDVQLKRGTQKWQIYEALKELKVASHADLSAATKIPRHLVPDRVIALIKDNLVTCCGEKTDPFSHKTVTVYKVLSAN